MTQNQIRFVRTLTATWKVLRDPVLTTIYTKKWKNRKDKLQTIYGYVFREMYKAAWCSTRKMTPTTDKHGWTRKHGIYISLVLCSSVRFSGRNITTVPWAKLIPSSLSPEGIPKGCWRFDKNDVSKQLIEVWYTYEISNEDWACPRSGCESRNFSPLAEDGPCFFGSQRHTSNH